MCGEERMPDVEHCRNKFAGYVNLINRSSGCFPPQVSSGRDSYSLFLIPYSLFDFLFSASAGADSPLKGSIVLREQPVYLKELCPITPIPILILPVSYCPYPYLSGDPLSLSLS